MFVVLFALETEDCDFEFVCNQVNQADTKCQEIPVKILRLESNGFIIYLCNEISPIAVSNNASGDDD